MIVYRMHRPVHDVFDPTGAFLKAGRWHSPGTRMLYTAQHASLAVLETLINAQGLRLPPRLITRIIVPGACRVEYTSWMEKPHSQRFGDLWVRERRSAVLAVPSVVINQMELNFLLNPAHPDFAGITHEQGEQFVFDPRFRLEAE